MTENIDWPAYQKALREGRYLLKEYPAPLNAPIVVDAELLTPPLATENIEPFLSRSEIAAREQYQAKIQTELEQRAKLLAHIYGIEVEGNPDFWYEIASALMLQHVPGMRQTTEPPPPPPKTGAPKKYGFDDYFQIYVDVQSEIDKIVAKDGRRNQDRLASEAIRNLLPKNRFKKTNGERMTIGSAKVLYNEAKNVVKTYENPTSLNSLSDLGRSVGRQAPLGSLASLPGQEMTMADKFAAMIEYKKELFDESRNVQCLGFVAYKRRRWAKIVEPEIIALAESMASEMRREWEKVKVSKPSEEALRELGTLAEVEIQAEEVEAMLEETETMVADLEKRLAEIK